MLTGQERKALSSEALESDYLQNFEFLQPRQGLWMNKRKVIASQPSGKDCNNNNNNGLQI